LSGREGRGRIKEEERRRRKRRKSMINDEGKGERWARRERGTGGKVKRVSAIAYR